MQDGVAINIQPYQLLKRCDLKHEDFLEKSKAIHSIPTHEESSKVPKIVCLILDKKMCM